jgi:hypothetical protein
MYKQPVISVSKETAAVLQEKSLLSKSSSKQVTETLSLLSSSSPTHMPPFPFPLSLAGISSSSFSTPRWGPPELVLCPTSPPPRHHYGRQHDGDYGNGNRSKTQHDCEYGNGNKSKTDTTTSAVREHYLKSSPDISKTTTGTTATSSDNDNDYDGWDHNYNYNYGTTEERQRPRRTRRHRDETFHFDIEDDLDAADYDEDRRDRKLLATSTQEPSTPLSARYYLWDESSRDSVSTISTWKSFELEDHNPSAERCHGSEYDDNGNQDGGRADGRWESPHDTEVVADKGQDIIMPGKQSCQTGVPSLDRQGILPMEKPGDETIWSQFLMVDPFDTQASGDYEHCKLALFPTQDSQTPETFTFVPPLQSWANFTVVPSVGRGVESDHGTPRSVLGPWIDFRLPENPFSLDIEFALASDEYDDDMPYSPFAPIEQPPLAPKKAFVVASPQADRPSLSFVSSCTSSQGDPTSIWIETTPREREQAVDMVTTAPPPTPPTDCSMTHAYSITEHHRIPVQQAPTTKNTVAKLARCDESVAVLGKGKRMFMSARWSRESNVDPLQTSGEAVVSGSKAAAKLAKSSITRAKVGRQNMGPGSAADQAFREKKSTERRLRSKVVIEPVRQAFAVNSVCRRHQMLGQRTSATETIKSNPVKSFVSSNSRSTRPNVRKEAASDPAKSPIVNAKSGSQLLSHGTVSKQQRQEKDFSGMKKPSCSTQRRAPILLGHLLEERYQAALRTKDVFPLKTYCSW